MIPVVASETSLYEFVAKSSVAPTAMQVSAATFKSLMSSLLDLLIEQQINAIVWTKLPKGDAWKTELDRYRTHCPSPQQVYSFKNQRELADLEAPSIQLPIDSPLRREYFLLIWSKEFCALLVAQRSKSSLSDLVQSPLNSAAKLEDEGAEKKQSLIAFLSLEAPLIQGAFEVLRPVAIEALTPLGAENGHDIDSRDFEQERTALITQLLTKHIQRQEELWQRASTHRRQAETANLLQLQNEELLNTIRLKDEFLNNVGQELRTPLTNIKTALTLLNSPSLRPQQKQRYMDLLTKECDRQSSLIRSLLDLVNLDLMAEPSTIQALQLIDVVPAVVSTYQPLAEEKGVRLAYTVPETLPSIACLNNWLKQIVINLLHNGIKFTPRGGQVWVRAKQQGDYIQLEFKDTGVGIAPSEIPKIFDRFYRVRQAIDEDTGGAGLGLTIVQQLLLRCGGSISVKSRIGEGTTFNVLLPIYRGDEKSDG